MIETLFKAPFFAGQPLAFIVLAAGVLIYGFWHLATKQKLNPLMAIFWVVLVYAVFAFFSIAILSKQSVQDIVGLDVVWWVGAIAATLTWTASILLYGLLPLTIAAGLAVRWQSKNQENGEDK